VLLALPVSGWYALERSIKEGKTSAPARRYASAVLAMALSLSYLTDKLCPPSLSKSSVGTQKRVFRPCVVQLVFYSCADLCISWQDFDCDSAVSVRLVLSSSYHGSRRRLFSVRLEQSVDCMCFCVFVWQLFSEMTYYLDVWHVVHLDTFYIKFNGQGYRSKFMVVEGKNSDQVNIFGISCMFPCIVGWIGLQTWVWLQISNASSVFISSLC